MTPPPYLRDLELEMGLGVDAQISWVRARAYEGRWRDLVVVLLFADVRGPAWSYLRNHVSDAKIEEWLLGPEPQQEAHARHLRARLDAIRYGRSFPVEPPNTGPTGGALWPWSVAMRCAEGGLWLPLWGFYALPKGGPFFELKDGPHMTLAVGHFEYQPLRMVFEGGFLTAKRERASPWAESAWQRFVLACLSLPPILGESPSPHAVASGRFVGLGEGWAELALDVARRHHALPRHSPGPRQEAP